MKILIADDNLFYRTALGATLREWGYDVIAVGDGAAAWDVLSAPQAPQLAILDWVMPKCDGLEVCRRLRALHRPEPTYVIVLTAKAGKENIVAALENGADDYISKPFDREELQARLRVGRRIVGLQTSQTVVFALARAVEGKSPYTHGHSERVTQFAVALADELGIAPADREVLRKGGLLHDIGKICIRDDVLNKPGPLTDEEYELIKTHPIQGVTMVSPLESLKDTIPLIRWHHERCDGTGYPDRIGKDKLPFLVRILSVADVYDALASDRPYRPGMSHTRCLEIMHKDAHSGGLDPELVRCFSGIDQTILGKIKSPRTAKVLETVLEPADVA